MGFNSVLSKAIRSSRMAFFNLSMMIACALKKQFCQAWVHLQDRSHMPEGLNDRQTVI